MFEFKFERGQTLLEVLVAMGIAIVVLGAISITVINSLNNASYAKNQNLATQYAQEGMEYVRSLRNIYWSTTIPSPVNSTFPSIIGAWCLDNSKNLTQRAGNFCTNPNVGTFKRQVTFTNNPDGTGACTQQAKVEVLWTDGKCPPANGTIDSYCHESKLVSCFSAPSTVTNPVGLNLLTNLVSYWKLDEASGQALDYSGVNNGTPGSGATIVTVGCEINNCRAFNGTGTSFIDLGNSNATGNYKSDQSFTVSAWINPVLNNLNQGIVSRTDSTSTGWQLILTSNKARFILERNPTSYVGSDTAVITVGWHQIVGVWNASTTPATATTYLDGTLNSTSVVSGTLGSPTNVQSTSHLFLGKGYIINGASSTNYFYANTGKIDEVGLWSRALAPDEIQYLYSQQLAQQQVLP